MICISIWILSYYMMCLTNVLYKLQIRSSLLYERTHLANDASLKTTKEQIELSTDQTMYELMGAGIRGRISMVSNSYAIANNCYFYDQKEDRILKLSTEEGIYSSKKHLS